MTRVRAAGPPLVRLVPRSIRAQPIHVGAGVCGRLRPGAVLVRGRDTDPRGAPLRRGPDLAGRQVHDPGRSPPGARVSVQARSGALRHAGLPLRAAPVPGGPAVTPHRIDPRRPGAAGVPPPLIRVSGGIRDRRVPRVGRARLAHLPHTRIRARRPRPPTCQRWRPDHGRSGVPRQRSRPTASRRVRVVAGPRSRPGSMASGAGGCGEGGGCSVSAAVAGGCG